MACPRLNSAWLERHPLPAPAPDGDKEAKGHALVIAGSREMPGAAILAAVAVLRAGAGKVTVLTGRSVAAAVAAAVPESRVAGAPESSTGTLLARGMRPLVAAAAQMSALLIGPGFAGGAAGGAMVRAAIAACGGVPTILDAAAMDALAGLRTRQGPILITPHAGELAHLTGWTKEAILTDVQGCAARAAAALDVLVLLKGASSVLASPEGLLWRHESRHEGLGTSGSGDVLAGLIAGLAARGVELPLAAAWGVALHARCGARLEKAIGTVGYLARELVDEIPRALREISRR
jgi:ADP-dependent NAD(P)H-hydrate dehydratase